MSIQGHKKMQSACYIILIAILIVYFFTQVYYDILATYDHSLILLDCFFGGNPRSFYDAALTGAYRDIPANYLLPIYIIFSVWNLPSWLLSRLGGIDPFSVGCILWLKGLVVLFTVGCGYYVRKILQLLENKDVEFGVFLFFSSMMVAIPTFSVAQYDVISVFFVLWGIFRGVQEERISVKTALIFSFGIPLKFFALFPYAILLLLKEKRIIQIAKNLAIGMLVTIISIVPFLPSKGFHASAGPFSINKPASLLLKTIDGGLTGLSLFCACLFIVYIIAYAWEPGDKKDLIMRLIWLGTFFYLALFTFIHAQPYWIVLLAPFAIILAIQNNRNIQLSLILEIAMECGIIVAFACVDPGVYLYENGFASLLMKRVPVVSDLLGAPRFPNLANVSVIKGFEYGVSGIYTLFAVMGGALLVLNFPTAHPEAKRSGGKELEIGVKTGVCFVRVVCLAAYFLIAVAVYYFI